MKIENACKTCRREGQKLFLKGEKCNSPHCPFIRRSYAPGQHGAIPKRVSEYGAQLREKQKAKRMYGLREKQFQNYFQKASKMSGVLGENLLTLLEMRLDNIVYSSGFATSRRQARQLVNHGHFSVNGKSVDISSYFVDVGSEVSLKERSKKLKQFSNLANRLAKYKPPSWLELDKKKLTVKVRSKPKPEELPQDIDTSLIVEYYSR